MKTKLFLCFFTISVVLSIFCQAQDEIIFQTEGASFSPLIQLSTNATVLWTFADGTTSSSLNPTKDYGTILTRQNRLTVTPWNALRMINIGYDGGDGGGYLPFVSDQHVSKVKNLSLVKNNLEVWCSSYNLIDTLIFDDFVLLDSVECFLSQSLKYVSLRNTPSVTRLCFEDNNLDSLDISGCTSLADLRGAQNNYTTIDFSNSTEKIWHICVRDNPQMTNDSLFSNIDRFPNISELFIWNTNQKGTFCMSNSLSTSVIILANENHFSAVDLRGSLQNENGYAYLSFNANNIKSLHIEGCDQIKDLNLWGNGMSADTVDYILKQLDEFGTWNGTIDLRGNEMPTAEGFVFKQHLEDKNWSVFIEGPMIEIFGNDTLISDSDSIPSIRDNTDFSEVNIGETVSHRFIIQNNGSYDLHLTGQPTVSITGPAAFDFSFSALPYSIVHDWGGSDTMIISFIPKIKGLRQATVTINNDGVNCKNPYTFNIQGNAIDSSSIISDKNQLETSINIFPNPNHGIFTIKSINQTEDTEVIVFNLQGIEEYRTEWKSGSIAKILLDNVNKGVYLIKVQNHFHSQFYKIIIQ